MNIKNMNEEELIDVMTQIKEICNEAPDCGECIFCKIYYNHPTKVCPFNETPFRWDFRNEIKND